MTTPNEIDLAAALEQSHLLPSRLLSPHARYYVREMRILAYSQQLESYRSLTLQNLSSAFGVSIDFIDKFVHLVILFVQLYPYFFPSFKGPFAFYLIGPSELYD
jgi:hypothetical protein